MPAANFGAYGRAALAGGQNQSFGRYNLHHTGGVSEVHQPGQAVYDRSVYSSKKKPKKKPLKGRFSSCRFHPQFGSVQKEGTSYAFSGP